MYYKYRRGQIFGKKIKVPIFVQKRIYDRTLSLSAYFEYDLEDKIPITCLNEIDQRIIKRLGVEKCRNIDWALLNNIYFYDGYLNEINNILLTVPTSEEDINRIIYDYFVDKIAPYDFTPQMMRIYPNRVFEITNDLSVHDNYIMNEYNRGSLSLIDMIENWNIVQSKNLSFCLKKDGNNTFHITDTILKDFMNNYSSIVDLVLDYGDIYTFISELYNLAIEERINYIKKFTDGLLEGTKELSSGISNYRSHFLFNNEEYREIFKYSSFQDYIKSIDNYEYKELIQEINSLGEDYLFNMPFPFFVIANSNVLRFLDIYGLKNVVDFENESGPFFSKNDCELLKSMFEIYIHYGGDERDLTKTIFTKKRIDENGNYIDRGYTKEEFYEAIKRMILYGPTNWQYNSKVPDYRDLTGEFRMKNQELFLDEDAPKDLQDLFYTKTITPRFIAEHHNYIEYLRGKKLSCCFKKKSICIVKENGQELYQNMYEYLEKMASFDQLMSFIIDYCDILEVFYDWNLQNKYRFNFHFLEGDDLSKICQYINKTYMSAFVQGELPFPKIIPMSLKDSYPNCFLPDNVDIELKNKFYNRELTVSDFDSHPNWINAFVKTNIVYGFPIDMAWLISLFNNVSDIKLTNVNRLKVLTAYSSIHDTVLQKTFKEYFNECGHNINFYKIEYVSGILTRLSLSNSMEIYTFRKELANQLLNTDNPMKSLTKIEDVFVKNNIPTVGKIFSCFEILYPDFKGLNFNNSMISPVLKKASNGAKRIIIFSDLIKAAFGSNNRSVNAYIRNISLSTKLLEEIKKGKITYDMLNETDKKELITFSRHLITLYNNSLLAKRKNDYYSITDDTLGDIYEIAKRISPNGDLDYSLGDRIIRMFCGYGGIDTINQARSYINNKVRLADNRNRERAKSDLIIEKGDFIKGVGGLYFLKNILQNGNVSKEYLGSNARSDYTPLDTDVSIVIDSSGTPSEIIERTSASEYGPIWFVLKNDNRFVTTRTIDGVFDVKRDFSKIEVFYTGETGRDHYGIRTGFASSDIDYIVVESYDQKVGLEIAKNGFYIPVYDKNGKIIFTPNDYDELRAKMAGLSYYGEDNYDISNNIITNDTEVIASQIEQSNLDIEQKKLKIYEIIRRALEELGLHLKTNIDGDLTPGFVELIDTGSTGRGTNKIGGGDFDFMMRLDRSIISDSYKFDKLKKVLLKNLGGSYSEVTRSGDFRLQNIQIDANTIVDINLTFVKKTDNISYSTDMALEDRLMTIKKNNPSEYKYVIANIILAKQVLKDAGVYKANRGRNPEGGLGGVGVENWILQNGGSFIDASISFLKASEDKTFQEFSKEYSIWDFGENHLAEEYDHYPHDNFVTVNMSEEGYKKMCSTLREYLMKVNEDESISTLR